MPNPKIIRVEVKVHYDTGQVDSFDYDKAAVAKNIVEQIEDFNTRATTPPKKSSKMGSLKKLKKV